MNLLFLNLGTQEMALIMIPFVILFVYTMYHVITNKSLNTYQRSLWILIIILGSLLGWLLYWALGRNRQTEEMQGNH